MSYNPDSYDGNGPMPTLYTRCANGAINQWTCWVSNEHVHVQWGQVNGELQHSTFICGSKNIGRRNETTAHQQAVREAVAKWKQQVKKKYYESAALALASFNLKPMLAHEFLPRQNKRRVVYPVDVQPKFDGVRCLAYRKNGVVTLQSRGGDPYDVAHITAVLELTLPENIVLDGELYAHGVSRQNIISLVKRPQKESVGIGYRIYDTAHLDVQDTWRGWWQERKEDLKQWFNTNSEVIKRHKHIVCSTQTYVAYDAMEVKRLHDEFVQEGFEGAIVRQRQGLYKFGHRSYDLLKYKEFLEEDFPIIGWQRGRGKFHNVPIFKCSTKDGKDFDVVPRGTDAERLEMLRSADATVGRRMLSVRFFSWSDDGVPYFPVGVCVRPEGV